MEKNRELRGKYRNGEGKSMTRIGQGGEERKVGRGTDEARREAVDQSSSVTHTFSSN